MNKRLPSLLDRIKAAVAARLDEVEDRYLASCGDTPPSAEKLKVFDRLKNDPRMERAWRELGAKRIREFEHPVKYEHLLDEYRKTALVAELDRRDELRRKAGTPPVDPAERTRWIDSLPLIGDEADRIVQAAASLACCAADLVLHPPPAILVSKEKGIDDLRTAKEKAEYLLRSAREIEAFLWQDNTTSYDQSVFDTLKLAIIPALQRNLAAKEAPIYRKIQRKSKKNLEDVQGPLVILHELVRLLFGPEATLYSPMGNIIFSAFGFLPDRRPSRSEIEDLIISAEKNVSG